jgi:hypothetical protein
MLVAVLAIVVVTAIAGRVGQATPALAGAPVRNVYQYKGLSGNAGTSSYRYCGSYSEYRSVYVEAWEQSWHGAGQGQPANDNWAYVSYGRYDYCDYPASFSYEYGSAYAPIRMSGSQQHLDLSGDLTFSRVKYDSVTGYSYDTVVGSLDAALEADGQYSSHGVNNSSYSYTYGMGHSRNVGTYNSAALSGSLVIDGEDVLAGFPNPDYSYSYGQIGRTASGNAEFYYW